MITREQAIAHLKKQGWAVLRSSGRGMILGKGGRTCVIPFTQGSRKDFPKGLRGRVERITGVRFPR